MSEGSFDRRMEPFAALIGELCSEWANLEGWVSRLFMMVGQWNYLSPGAMEMARCLSVRDQLSAIKVGVVARGFDGDICDAVIGSVDYIDNILRSVRNRYIHDIWALADDKAGALRFEITPKVRKAFAGQHFVEHGQMEYLSLADIKQTIQDIVDETIYIQHLICVVKWPPGSEYKEPPLKQPQRRLLLRQQEKQRQSDKALAERRRLQKPSPG